MEYVKGKYRNSIFEASNSGYMVGLFRVSDCSESLKDYINIPSTITFTGYFTGLNNDDNYIFKGEYIKHDRYGYQFKVESYERIEPEGTDAVVDFLTSSFVKGCGKKTAEKIVSALGDDALKLIKEDKTNLYKAGVSVKTAETIYKSLMEYYGQDELIVYLKSLDFTVKEITKMISMYGNKIKEIVQNDLYSLIDIIDFKKLDHVFFKLFEDTNDMRILGCLLESLKRLSFENGDTYSTSEEIYEVMIKDFDIDLYDRFDHYIECLKNSYSIKVINDRYYLMNLYQAEKNIADTIYHMTQLDGFGIKDLDLKLERLQQDYNIVYNDEQKKAIKEALLNQITIITGGPGTGKTTIINGILKLYQEVNNIPPHKLKDRVALLAPTGRASKRMSEATYFPASTIHRYLKWNHDSGEFAVNEYNKTDHELIIIDELSMIDCELFSSLLNGISGYAKVVLVGDSNQLPSVSAGNILKDLIDSDIAPHIELKNIYRQSNNSFIPILASEIKNVYIESNLDEKRDDYNFLKCDRSEIKMMIAEIMKKAKSKGLTEKDMQVLIPMYRGENGIDNINMLLQELFNPRSDDKNEITFGSVIYRENDKVINLVNNVDQNIFNGDIGYVTKVNPKKSDEIMEVDFYGNKVTFKREDLTVLKHAYAMSIHKSQGSEFNHVIMPLSREYSRMLYNRLIYTGVSRAKKSLLLIGDQDAFIRAVNNPYSEIRKTSLKDMLIDKVSK